MVIFGNDSTMSLLEIKKHIQTGITLSDKSFKTKLAPNFRLSVYLNADQLVYCVTDILSRKLLHLKSYNFFNILCEEEYKDTLQQMIAGDDLLRLLYGKIHVHLLSDCFTLVPENLFDESKKTDLLEFNQQNIQSFNIKHEAILKTEAIIIYGVDIETENILNSYFPKAKISHSSSSLIETWISPNTEGEMLHCYVQASSIQIAYVKHAQLKFFNIYQHKTPEDFLYYLMNVVNHLSLDQDKINLLFSGEVVMDSGIYKLAYKYIRNIHFAQRPQWVQCSDEMIFPGHFYFNLFCIES